MSLQLILGSSGSGKSHFLYEEVIDKSIQNPNANYLMIVPEQFTLQTQKDIVSLHPRNGTMNIDILSFMRLAYRIFDEVGGNDKPVLEDTGKSMILRKVMASKKKELQLFNKDVQKKGFISELKSLISEIYQYSINDKTLEQMQSVTSGRPMLKSKLNDILVIYKGFSQFLDEKYITAEEILDVLCEVINKSEIIKNSIICFDGFTGFTPSQYKLLTILMKTAKKVIVTLTIDVREKKEVIKEYELFGITKRTMEKLETIAMADGIVKDKDILVGKEGNHKAVPYRFKENPVLAAVEDNIFRFPIKSYQGECDSVSIHVAKDNKSEASFVVREILKLIKEGYRYNQIAIITGDIEGYGRIFNREFDSLGIPCFVDSKRAVLSNPLVELIRSVLNIFTNQFDYESVFRYLRCGLVPFDKEEVDMLENYVIALGIRGKKRYEAPFERLYKGQDGGELDVLNQLRVSLMEQLMPLYEVIHSEITIEEYTKGLYSFCESMKVRDSLKGYILSFQESNMLLSVKEYEQIYERIIDLFDKLVELLGEEKASLKEFVEILEAGFEEIKVGLIPPGLDPLVVGDIERTRLKDIKALFFVGMNDSIIPKKSGGGGILSDLERQLLADNHFEMAPTKRQATFTEQFYLYMNVTKPTDHLYLTYSKTSSDGKAIRPAYFIDMIKQVLPRVKVIDEDMERNTVEYALSSDKGLSYLIKGIREYGLGDEDELFKELFSFYHRKEEYRPILQGFIDAAYYINNEHGLSRQVANDLYGGDLNGSVTRFEKYAGCAFAHYVSYGLELNERKEYKIMMPDIGNLFHTAIELYSRRLAESEYTWHTISDELRDTWATECVKEACYEYGNSILTSSKRYEYVVNRVDRITKRTLWALTYQIKSGDFEPVGYEVDFNGANRLSSLNIPMNEKESIRLRGRIDRMDTFVDEENVMLRVVDYKSGSTSFDLLSLYYGLQIQLALYLNAAKELLQKENKGKKIIPAGLLYYNINDPYVYKTNNIMESILKELKMNGIVNKDKEVLIHHDTAFNSNEEGLTPSIKSNIIPVESNKDGGLTKRSKVASEKDFDVIGDYVRDFVRTSGMEILKGNTDIKPYQLEKRTACDYCPYGSVCGFDPTIEGFEYRKLCKKSTDEVWEDMKKGSDWDDEMDNGSTENN